MDTLILVDQEDNAIGYEEKEVCHVLPTKLHRAFSIFIVNGEGEMLIHKRAMTKKTWPGYWTNACCSHPRKGETLAVATQRRLQEELGFACPVIHLMEFPYQVVYDETYGENEVDHIFLGTWEGPLDPDKKEIDEWSFVPIETLVRDVSQRPEKYTPWFKLALPGTIRYLNDQTNRRNKRG